MTIKIVEEDLNAKSEVDLVANISDTESTTIEGSYRLNAVRSQINWSIDLVQGIVKLNSVDSNGNLIQDGVLTSTNSYIELNVSSGSHPYVINVATDFNLRRLTMNGKVCYVFRPRARLICHEYQNLILATW